MTNRDAASVDGYIGTATVVNGELAVSWIDGSLDVFSPQEREFSEGVPFPYHTFLPWSGDRPLKAIEIRAPSFAAALDLLESRLLEPAYAQVSHVSHISHNVPRSVDGPQTPFVRTVGGYAPLAA